LTAVIETVAAGFVPAITSYCGNKRRMPGRADKFTQCAQAWLRAGHHKSPIGAPLSSPCWPAHLSCVPVCRKVLGLA